MSCSRSIGRSSFVRSRWKHTEQTIWFEFELSELSAATWRRIKCSNMTSMTQRHEHVIRAKPGHRIHLALEKLKMTFSSRPPHRRTILKNWKNKYIAATKQQRDVQLHRPQNTNYLRDTGGNTTHMVFEGEIAVKRHPKNVKVGTSTNGNPRQDQVTIESVDSPRFANHWSLSFVRIQYHAPVMAPLLNPSQVPVKGGSESRSVCWLANNCH